jgi:hypothetical protein
MLKVAKGGRRKSPWVVGFTGNSLLDILFFMIWTLFDFCFLMFDYLPPRLPAHTSQKSTPPLQGIEICAADKYCTTKFNCIKIISAA